MKYFIGILLLLLSATSSAQDKESLLSAWENIQKNSDEVELFERLDNGKYKIKFVTLPFDGELQVLTYDVEDIGYSIDSNSQYEKVGYLELDLIGASQEMLAKYGRTYYKWTENNTLYFNKDTDKWVTGREYNNDLMKGVKIDAPSSFFLIFFEYWNYFLAAAIIYFLVSQVRNTKQVKNSIRMQKEAISDMQKAFTLQNEEIELHKKTNETLADILKELRKRKE